MGLASVFPSIGTILLKTSPWMELNTENDIPKYRSFLIKGSLVLKAPTRVAGERCHPTQRIQSPHLKSRDPRSSWKLFLGNSVTWGLCCGKSSFPDECFPHKQQHLIISLNRGKCNTLLCRLISQKIPCIYD